MRISIVSLVVILVLTIFPPSAFGQDSFSGSGHRLTTQCAAAVRLMVEPVSLRRKTETMTMRDDRDPMSAGERSEAACCRELLEAVVELTLAVVAAELVVPDVAGARELVRRDRLVADADRGGDGTGAVELTGGKRVRHGGHSEGAIAARMISHITAGPPWSRNTGYWARKE